jgi:anti-anti-sigma factor
MGIKVENRDGKVIIFLGGDLNLTVSVEIKEAILVAESENKPIVIDLNEAESIDISCIQLLCSANRQIGSEQGQLALVIGKNKELFKNILVKSGYNPGGSCSESPCEHCLWTGEV